MNVSVLDVRVSFGERPILHGVDLCVDPGEFLGIVGPNGSGKTTLLRTIYRALRPHDGTVSVAGDDVWSLRSRAVAQRVAVVGQDHPNEFATTVRELVLMGRMPHQGLFDRDSAEDHARVADALAAVDATHLAERNVAHLSGGERQRVLVARSLAQASPLLLLDEPTNHLDIHHQLELLGLVRDLGLTVISTLHDLNLAAAWCDRVVVLDAGAIVADGPPEVALSVATVERVYGLRAVAFTHPLTGAHQLALHRR